MPTQESQETPPLTNAQIQRIREGCDQMLSDLVKRGFAADDRVRLLKTFDVLAAELQCARAELSRGSSTAPTPDTDAPIGDGVECVDCAAIREAFTSSKPPGENAPAQRALAAAWPELYAAISDSLAYFRERQSGHPAQETTPDRPEIVVTGWEPEGRR